MVAQIVKGQVAGWRVVVPWQKGETTTDVVAAELTAQGKDITVKLIGNSRPITFPLERAKLLLDALRDAVAFCEVNSVSST